MDFLNGNIKPIYFKYLSAAFGSAMITSVYSIVDMAMVGQYHGLFRPVLDGLEHGLPQSLYPHFHVTHPGHFGYGPSHRPHQRAVVFALAVQYFHHLLFSRPL